MLQHRASPPPPMCVLALALLVAATSALAAADPCRSCGDSHFPTPAACAVNGTAVNPAAEGCCADDEAIELLGRLLDVLAGEAYEATAATLDAGNSPFGAAVLHNAPGYPLLHAGANKVETEKTPTAHGEVSTINGFFQTLRDGERPPVGETVFLATHQPCSMCLSALAFAGFRRVYYGFDFELSLNGGEEAGEVLDVAVMEELFSTTCGRINHTNGMMTIVPLSAALQLEPCAKSKKSKAKADQSMEGLRGRYRDAFEKFAKLGEAFQGRMASSGGGGMQLLSGACVGCQPYPRDECGWEQTPGKGQPPAQAPRSEL